MTFKPAVRPYATEDRREWLRMRRELWPSSKSNTEEEKFLEKDADKWLARQDAATFVAVRPAETGLCGFAEVGERPYADGCLSDPVAFLEAWYVDPDMRFQQTGAALIAAVEVWSRGRGYRELASDALLDNVVSPRASRGRL